MSQLNVGTVNISSLLVLPQYSTSQLPSGVAVGTIVFDTDEEAMVIWNGSEWSSAGGGGGGGLADLVSDTTPQLGGDLDCNGYDIVTGQNRITFASGSGIVSFMDFTNVFDGVNNNTTISSVKSINLFLDSNGGDSGQAFRIFNNKDPDNDATVADSDHIFKVFENGNVSLKGSLTSSQAGTPTVISTTDLHLQAGTGAANRVEIKQAPFKIASFTTTQRDAKTSQDGDLVYNSTTNSVDAYVNGAWTSLSSGGGGGTAYDQSLNTTDSVTFASVTTDNLVTSTSGTPTIASASNIVLNPTGSVVVQTGGFRLANLDTTARNALTASNGEMIYNTTVNKIQMYESSAWTDVGTSTVGATFTLTANGTSDYVFAADSKFFPTATNDPVLYLRRGETYTFVNNSGGSHPFEIRVSNGGAAYNTGVTGNGSSTGNIVFTVPMSAPATLYYQCQNHSVMGNTINIV